MAFYETTFITRQDISAADADKLANQFSDLIKEMDGKVLKKEYWGLRNLAYRINKGRKGHYVMLGIEATGDTVKELERKYKINEDIIRNLTIRVESISDAPSPMLKSADNDDRPSFDDIGQ